MKESDGGVGLGEVLLSGWGEGGPPEAMPAGFFEPGARAVARRLLGHWLVRRVPGLGTGVGGLIVETEAYLQDDPACHAYRGPTARNRSMFGPPGRAYVYFIYGNHWCFNVVCRGEGIGEAVLIRAIEPSVGAGWMADRRPGRGLAQLTNGPAKCCQALDVDRSLDGIDLTGAGAAIYVGRNPQRDAWVRRRGPLVTGPRIGIREAADWPLRFYLSGSPWVSRR